MTAINFPDPAGQTPVNTFGPTTTPEATSNGMTYVYADKIWKASKANGATYVKLAGDTMTGSLALNDKITLDATDGNADFAGTVSTPGVVFDTEALSDYEEGTWTATGFSISDGTTSKNGKYIRIGNIVHVTLDFYWTGGFTINISESGVAGLPYSGAVDRATGVWYANWGLSVLNDDFANGAFIDTGTVCLQSHYQGRLFFNKAFSNYSAGKAGGSSIIIKVSYKIR